MAQSQLVRYKTGKYNFEVMTNVGSALKYRKQELGLDNVIQADIVRSALVATLTATDLQESIQE